MALIKREYTDQETVITGKNLNDIQDAVIALEDGLFTVDNDKSGEVITITDASNRGFLHLNIYGKTTQAGTPTPTAPVDLVSAGGGGSITVSVTSENNSRNMTISTPNGLPGIPVTTGGNYTDENGQQWICDEVDFEKGVYIQRVGKIDRYNGEALPGAYISSTGTLSAGATVLYQLESDKQTDISTEKLAEYAAMYTNYQSTTVYNDADAGMEVKYVADTKLYVDNKFNVLAAMVNDA